MRRAFGLLAVFLLLIAGVAHAQTEVLYTDDFQSYGKNANPPGWIDNSIGKPRPQAEGLYKTRTDPTGPNNGTNLVYGTVQASGKPEGNNPRIGTFSTLGTHDFAGKGRFEYRGRMIRTNDDTRIGLTFFSSYPETDKYYLIGLWSQPSGNLTLQLFGFGAGTFTGTVDSNLTLEPNKWYRFLVQVDDANDATKIRARFWLDGTTEPSTFVIDAVDAAPTRLKNGRIGIWSAVKGDAFVDDLFAKSPVDHTPPVIEILESGTPLADGSKFNRDAVPEIRVTDDLSTFSYTATLDGAPYTSLTPVTIEGWHTLAVHAVDGPGNASDAQVKFLVDKTPPAVAILEGTTPFPPGFYFNRDVIGNATVTDISQTTVTAAVDDQPYTLGTPITAEGSHTISVTAVDEVGWSTTAGPIPFVIDKTPPALTFTSHSNGQVLTAAHAILIGGSDDAVTVAVGGSSAVVDGSAKTFTSVDLPLLEGDNDIVASGTDLAGNTGTATLKLVVDTRAPEVSFTAPAVDACVDATTLQVSGTVTDPRVDKVVVKIGDQSINATISGSNWTASVPVAEGKTLITVEASDTVGHTTSSSRTVIVDRTAPLIEISEAPQFTNRPVTFFVSAKDADANVVVTSKLDGNDYASGTSITTEGKHTLVVVATDCAGHRSEKTVEVTLDLTPPTIRNLNPANDATVGTMPNAIAALTDTDATKVEITGTQLSATPASDGAFTIAAVPFAEGTNRFTLVATDRAGNVGSLDYTVIVKTNAPVVEIRESGLEIPPNALFNRAVTPVIRSNEPEATITATLNGAAYTSGTTITGDGAYTLRATATDSFGHAGSAEATFTIDRAPPVVTISTPVEGTLRADRTEVRGNAGDSVSASVNGQPVALGSDGSFVLDALLLEPGPNPIVAIGRDRAGNTGRDDVLVTRDDAGAGIIITYPPDRSLTNRPTTDVVGRLLTPNRGTVVTVGGQTVETDPTGAFRVNAYPLTEGENAITATATATNGVQTSATTHVTADFTPPSLTILESNQPLVDGARFATQAVVSLEAADAGGGQVITTLSIDGTPIATPPSTVTAGGGHAAIATARDLAGNESRTERTFFIGTSGGSSDCTLSGFDPVDGAVVVSSTTTLIGRSGSALGVKVNGIAAVVADGSFSATVELPNEGPNVVTITCTDANGAPTGTPSTITLQRITGDPSITISTPNEGFVTSQETIAVTGTIGNGVVSADVNGVPATISGSTYTVPSVRLAEGLNILVAHGRNGAGRVATASRRVVHQGDAPAVSISTPINNTVTGSPKIDVGGTWSNLVPDTLTVTNVTAGNQTINATFVRFSDTTGSFTAADVPLAPGEQTLRVSGRDALNREASATVVVKLVSGSPTIVIDAPANHAYFGPGSSTFNVSGTFQAAAGSTVDINGNAATISGSTYTGTASFATLAGGITPVVARVNEPGGASAAATVFVTQLVDAPKVIESFPAPNAIEVDSGALMLVLFSQPMDLASLSGGAFRLENANGNPVSGTIYLDKDVLTFAPAALLTGGAQYTIRVTTAAKNLAGTALEAEYTSTFTVATSAPAVAPLVDPIGSAVCGESITVTGTAPAGTRVRLESGTLVLNTQADASGKFSFTWPVSGQSGFAAIRVRVVGSDGSVSPAAELNVRVDCSGPQVLNASFDRAVNKLTIQFSEPVAASTIGVGTSIVLTDEGHSIAGSAAVEQSVVTVTPAENLANETFSLTVTTAVEDLIGNALVAPYSQEFAIGSDEPEPGDGSGFISGEVYDATTGRPLPGAIVSIDVATPAPITSSSDARGRYLARLPEGAHTIEVALDGCTTVWREIIVPAGAGVIPIDIRLTRRGGSRTSDGSAMTLAHGGDTAVTKRVELAVPAGAVASGNTITLTAVGAQALTGLLPLGWSPIASAEVFGSISTGQLTFDVPANETFTAVHYDSTRDEWRVLAAAVTSSFAITRDGAYALVYPDRAPGLTSPPLPVAGDILQGVPAAPADAPALVDRDFTLDPPIVLPSGRTVATLRIEGNGEARYPSGTAVQAYIDEDLRLADGSRLLDPPFATDLLLYRTLAGDLGVADFHLAPSTKAAQVILEIGFDHIRILPYPGRLDRGTLIGSEGGRVPADDKVAIEISTGAVPEPLRATATSLSQSDLQAIGTIAGFRVVGGFQLSLQRATQPAPQDLDNDGVADPIAPVELFIPARATYAVDASLLPSSTSQVILAELLDQTPYGNMVRLAVPMMRVDASQESTPAIRFTTATIDRSVMPVDGVAHEGRYLVLAAESPIAFATGTIRLTNSLGRLMSDARVTAPPLGVAELSRSTGIYNIPVPARPAAPFTLIPRHTSTGDGAPYTHATQPDPDAIVRVDLNLVAQPPVLGSVVVMKGDPPSQATLTSGTVTKDVALTTNIRASFTPGIDPSSITADSISVTDTATGDKVSGNASAEGTLAVVWTLTAGERFKPNKRYLVVIAPSIRGTNGATLQGGKSFSFETLTQLVNTEIHRERIRITIPAEDGTSRIIGDPGALPANWQAVAVRRKKDFFVRYQATAASDGSFSFVIGNGDPRDRITMADLIDLQVVNTNGALAGIYALTPFVTEDGRGFVAPPDVAVRFTSPEGIAVEVPAGAFDVPTVVTVQSAQKQDFLDIPRIEDENEYAASVNIDFEGYSKKPLDVEVPVPAGYDTAGKDFILAWKGMSTRGPRLAVADVLRIENGKFTSIPDEAQNSRRVAVTGLRTGTHRTLTGKDFRDYLLRLIRGGRYMVLDIRQPVGGAVGWGVMDGLQAGYDLMWDIFWSYYDPYIHVFERPARVIPIITGLPFTVTGIDTNTGLTAFTRSYDPLPIGDPGDIAFIPSPQQNDGGPYPVYGTPFRVEILDLDVEEIDITSVRNFKVRLENGSAQVSPGEDPLDGLTKVQVINASNGQYVSGTAASPLTVSAKRGHRIALIIEQFDIDPSLPMTIAFNESLYTGESGEDAAIDQFLRDHVKVEQAPEPGPGGEPAFVDITAHARFERDSGGRRLNIILPSALQREAVYRVTLKSTLADRTSEGAGLKLGQGTTPGPNNTFTPTGGGNDFHLTFHTRKPAGELGQFTVSDTGILRDMALYGNVLFTASVDGGLRAFDVSNPAAESPLLGHIGPPNTSFKTLSVHVDHHGRIFTTEELNIVGVFRSYRVEDFTDGNASVGDGKASSITNWKLGYSSMIGLPSNTVLSDRPESIPYRTRVALQDISEVYPNRKAFVDAVGAGETGDWPEEDLKSYNLTVPFDNAPYKYERITVVNSTLDMRWSADASVDGPAVLNDILARSTDEIHFIRNKKTYAVIAHLGHGVAVFDVNAMESNRHPSTAYNDRAREQLFLGNGIVGRECNMEPPIWAIGENYLNLDAEIRGDAYGDVFVYAPHASKGVLDYMIHLPLDESGGGGWSNDSTCDQRGPTGLVIKSYPDGNEFPRISALKGAIGGTPFTHFHSVAKFHWEISAEENTTGQRGTTPGQAASRDYLLIASGGYGVVVVEIDGNPPTGESFPLVDDHIADFLWVPAGALGVRVIQEANVAVVNDRQGRAVLIDLSRIDERWDENGNWVSGLFPTVQKAVQGPSSGGGIGADDPRIIWKSETGVTSGSLPPLFDPSTGMVYGASMTGRRIKVLSAVDPTVRMKVNIGEGAGLSEVGGVIPLGVDPPLHAQQLISDLPACAGAESAQCKENASFGAFKLEVSLPGGMLDSLDPSQNELWVAVESERIAGAITEQTPDGFPRAHLRRTRRDGSSELSGRVAGNFKLRRVVPDSLAPQLKWKRGYNRFTSPWIIAIADPRASKEWDWGGASPQQKREAGCYSCDRPAYLENAGESDGVYELWTNGRFITVRAELNGADTTVFDGTDYSYLGQQKRIFGRFSTIIADTIRPTEVLVAGQNPPVATGMLEESLYLHSGELETNHVDLEPGGRAGTSVALQRTYRSRTLGGTAFGQGWDSPLLQRLRALPDGDVEYRDGAEMHVFTKNDEGGYDPPDGVFLRLARSQRGWMIIDQQWRITEFDDFGRVVMEADEFYDLSKPESGNLTRYMYDASGKLSVIVDPVNRKSNLQYWPDTGGGSGSYPGLLRQFEDWRGRKVEYEYDQSAGTLTKVRLAEVPNVSGGRPRIEYEYTTAGNGYKDKLELRTNLSSITDPHEAVAGGGARVRFTYDQSGSGFKRDRLLDQKWGTGESATFTYDSPTSATTKDVLGQSRDYTLSEQPKNPYEVRAQILTLKESGVRTSSAPFGELPAVATPGDAPVTSADRSFSYSYGPAGMVVNETLAGVRSTTNSYASVEPEAPGVVQTGADTTGVGGALNEKINYQSGANLATFIDSMSANGQTYKAPEPSRNNTNVSASNDAIQESDQYDPAGQVTQFTATGGTDSSSAGASVKVTYAPVTAAEHARGLPTKVDNGGQISSFDYAGPYLTVGTDERNVQTTIEYDTWLRPIHIVATGPQVTMVQHFEYDATGRLRKETRRQGDVDVTTTYAYDVMGRETRVAVDNVADTGTAVTSTNYDYPNRTITTQSPGGSTTTTTLDTLGRPATSTTTTGGSPIVSHYAFDLDDNLVFQSDGHVAKAFAYDAHGRKIGTRYADGSSKTSVFDGFGNPTQVTLRDASGAMIRQVSLSYTSSGRLQSTTETLAGGLTRTTEHTWDGAGRTTGVGDTGRAVRTQFDMAGRMLASASGAGSAQAIATPFESAQASSHSGSLPQKVVKSEKSGGAYQVALQYNTLGAAITQSLGGLQWNLQTDQSGNVTSATAPRRGTATFQYDSRGSLTTESQPGATMHYGYHGSGALASFTDPTSEATSTTNDLIGRPTARSYADGTSETIVWEGSRVKSITDRQGRTKTITYNPRGQIEKITNGSGVVVDEVTYDGAGRVIKWKTPDAVIEYSDFDGNDRPRKTKQSRYRGDTLVDSYTQEHTYNAHGERLSFTMPSYAGMPATNGWTQSVTLQRDATGNITRIERTTGGISGGGTLLAADYRNVGRPDRRTITTSSGTQIVRQYGYEADTGLMNRMEVLSGGMTLAGSFVTFDGMQKASAQLLGVSGGARADSWTYDDRGRLTGTVLARDAGAPPDAASLTPSDFRSAFSRVKATPVDPPSLSFGEAPGHKIASVQRGTELESFAYLGGERTGDGRFTYEYDEKGQLSVVTEKPNGLRPPRRVLYYYDGNDRMIGRRAEYQIGVEWKLEDRPDYLIGDALPAEATFVWDPVDDQLVAIFKSGASETATTDPNGGLIRQIIHGGFRYDDPIEVTTADDSSPSGVARLYPVYDEAGAASLDAILNESGHIVLRSITAGPYGEDEATLRGPAIDKVSVEAGRDADGNVTAVTVALRSTEQFIESTIANGSRLTVVDASGAVVRTSGSAPALRDASTITWAFTPSEWSAFVNPSPDTPGGPIPAALSVAVTKNARAVGWSATTVFLGAPDWAILTKPVYRSDDLPVEVRESLANLSQWLASIPADTDRTTRLYEVASLYALGAPRNFGGGQIVGDPSTLIVSSSFHAHPFLDPMTGKSYVRARWFDPSTGAWLTPDPRGYADSSNLYAYAANDPVNRHDPTGELWAFLIDAGFAIYDTYQYATGQISGTEYATRMALTGASILANAASGGMGAGLVVRATAMAGRAGRVAQMVMRGAQLINRADNIYDTAQAAVSAYDAIVHRDPKRFVFNAAQLLLRRKSLKNAKEAAGDLTKKQRRTMAAEYKHFRKQGFSQKEARYLIEPYNNGKRMGHHFPISREMAKKWGIPKAIRDSRFNVLMPRGISIGSFYELHHRVDRSFHGAALRKGMQSWRAKKLGLERVTGPRMWWEATPGALKWTVGGAAAAGGALTWWWVDDDED